MSWRRLPHRFAGPLCQVPCACSSVRGPARRPPRPWCFALSLSLSLAPGDWPCFVLLRSGPSSCRKGPAGMIRCKDLQCTGSVGRNLRCKEAHDTGILATSATVKTGATTTLPAELSKLQDFRDMISRQHTKPCLSCWISSAVAQTGEGILAHHFQGAASQRPCLWANHRPGRRDVGRKHAVAEMMI